MQCKKILFATITLLLTFALGACDKPGSAEKVGKDIDSAVEKAGNKIDDAKVKMSEKSEKAETEIEGSLITTKIKSATLAEPGLNSLDINVDTVGDMVTLTGNVDSKEKSDKAQQLAEAVDGVKQVNNQLVVQSK